MRKPKYHVFVCTSARLNGQRMGFCHSRDSSCIIQSFVEELEAREMTDDVMVSGTGCLGICSSGPVIVVYPDGVWYREVTPGDVAEIVESHLENGRIVERLEIK